MYITITKELINSARTLRGGFCGAQFQVFGMKFCEPGWRQNLIGKTVSKLQWEAFFNARLFGKKKKNFDPAIFFEPELQRIYLFLSRLKVLKQSRKQSRKQSCRNLQIQEVLKHSQGACDASPIPWELPANFWSFSDDFGPPW
jgi:hypothetical protein